MINFENNLFASTLIDPIPFEKETEEKKLNCSTHVFQEVNYGSDIFPLEPLPFPKIKFLLKPSSTSIKYTYNEIKYLQRMKDEKTSVLMRLFCDKFNKKMNPMAFYRLKITCAYNPIVINNNREWHHIINQNYDSKLEYDEEFLNSIVKKKLKHELAYKEYCSKHPNSINFLAFTKKISRKKSK